jgi:asparagine synthase (glutamine-hydrolysing)
MCAILHVFTRPEPVDRERFAAALACMKHRGPDHTGAAFMEVAGVHCAAGHQRLSILDLDPRSHQPFACGRRHMVFNGEIYNYRDLRPALENGEPFATTGDTEVLLRGLAAQGREFLHRANGMWAFSYVDEEAARVLAARDRYGKKPLFYYHDTEHLIIASGILAIHRVLGTKPVLNDAFVDDYLAHGAAFPRGGERTHMEGICQVPPGHALEFDLRAWSLKVSAWFDFAAAFAAPADTSDEALRETFTGAVRLRLVSDREVGLLLSGGIDSTLILSALHALGLQDQVHCFIGETGRSEDAAYAQKCIAQLGIKAQVVNLDYGKNTLDRVLTMCRHHEKPFPFLGSSIAMAEMFENIAQQSDVRVVLDGTGGDELFGGYWERYYPAALRSAWQEGNREWLAESFAHPYDRRIIRQAKLQRLSGGLLGTGKFKAWRKRRSPAAITLGLHRRATHSRDPLAGMQAGYDETVQRDISPGGQLGEWIWHNDRNSMMWGIEGRSPLLDHRLLPWARSGYARKFVQQWNKHELRRLFDALTPLPTQWRQQKQGFRWNGKVFLRENREAILAIIAGSAYLRGRFDIGNYVSRARRWDKFLVSGITPRLLCLAGLDAAFSAGG